MHRKERGRLFEEGQGLVEYAMVIILVGIIVILGLIVFGDEVSGLYCQVVEAVDSGSVPASCTEEEAPPEEDEGSISVSCGPIVLKSNSITMEATVADNAGDVTGSTATSGNPVGDITKVVFTINGHSITENKYHYCLGGTDSPCSSGTTRALSTFGMVSGHNNSYTVNVVATDAQGNTGSCSQTFTIP